MLTLTIILNLSISYVKFFIHVMNKVVKSIINKCYLFFLSLVINSNPSNIITLKSLVNMNLFVLCIKD